MPITKKQQKARFRAKAAVYQFGDIARLMMEQVDEDQYELGSLVLESMTALGNIAREVEDC